ncbi:MAG TPA: DUF2007 domain-containing protein [Usitatibacter sp.]|nr:DUF2007 domain-containing protein [Usitatibacter sp.]
MKRVYTASNLPEAHLLAGHLADRGVRALIFNANASSILGELPLEASLPQVWVEHPRDAERARALIDEFLRAPGNGEPRRCPNCSEENPPSFDLCWSCGAGLEGC